MRVVYWARLNLAREEVTEALAGVDGVEIEVVENLTELAAALPGAQALILYDAPPDSAREVRELLEAHGATVRWMHFLTAGREGFEAAGLPRGVEITYPAGAVAPTVAEHAMTLLLALRRCVPAMLEAQRERDWARQRVSDGAGTLEDGTMAIVGYGRIGRELSRRAKAFGVHTVGLSRGAKACEHLDESHPLDALDSVLARADFIVLAIALTAQTHHLIDTRRLGLCRPSALLVNVARGGVVDQAALAEALREGRLGGAGLDVVEPEPLPAADPLWEAPNMILSPHFAGGASAASRRRLAQSAAGNLRRMLAGEALLGRVA